MDGGLILFTPFFKNQEGTVNNAVLEATRVDLADLSELGDPEVTIESQGPIPML